MRFIVQTLPKLAVSAKLLCLLMVVVCGAAPSSMVRSVRLYNDCSSNDLRVDMRGRVLADDKLDRRFQNLTIRSEDFSMKLTIFAEESKRFLCFNPKWKLVGSKRLRGPRCQFYEEMQNGYNRYRSVEDESHFVGFNKKGRPLRDKLVTTTGFEKCFNFLKIDADFSIGEHNHKMSGGLMSRQPLYNSNANNVPGSFQVRLRHNRNRHKNLIELS